MPYHWGRFRGLAQELKKPLLSEHLLKNIFFDTCVYHQPGIDLLTKVIPVDNVLFASEMIGAVRGIDPETGHYYDDTKRYIEAAALTRRAAPRDLRRQRAPRVPAAGRRTEEEGEVRCTNSASSTATSPAPTARPPTRWPASAAPPCTRRWAASA